MDNALLEQLNEDLNQWRIQLRGAARSFNQPGKKYRLSIHVVPKSESTIPSGILDVQEEDWSFAKIINSSDRLNSFICWGESIQALYPPANADRLCQHGLVFSISPSDDNISKWVQIKVDPSQQRRFLPKTPSMAAFIYGFWNLDNADYADSINKFLIHFAIQSEDREGFLDWTSQRADGPLEIQNFDYLTGYPDNHPIYKLVKDRFLPLLLKQEDYSSADLTGLSYTCGVELSEKLQILVFKSVSEDEQLAMRLDTSLFENVIREAGEC